MPSAHRAAILTAPGQPLSIQDVDTHHPLPNEILIRNYCIAIQPLDAKILISAYGLASSLSYPAILGSSGAGLVEEVGSDVTNLQVGDRVVFDTKAYVDVDGEVNRRQGTWQQLVISRADTAAKVGSFPRFPPPSKGTFLNSSQLTIFRLTTHPFPKQSLKTFLSKPQ